MAETKPMADFSINPVEHNPQDLIRIFNTCFEATFNTRLERGGNEPIYLPADEQRPCHVIYFAHGYFSSALHEISHWLIAGAERRLLEDFGYWYQPDGRTLAQQALFEQVEVKPQALEWILSQAAGYRFYISADNLNGEQGDNTAFKQAVWEQVAVYCKQGLPLRADTLYQALCDFYQTSDRLALADFDRQSL